jgi:hypothetical protein
MLPQHHIFFDSTRKRLLDGEGLFVWRAHRDSAAVNFRASVASHSIAR